MRTAFEIAKEYLATLDATNPDRLAFDGKNLLILSQEVIRLREEMEHKDKVFGEVSARAWNQSQAIKEACRLIELHPPCGCDYYEELAAFAARYGEKK